MSKKNITKKWVFPNVGTSTCGTGQTIRAPPYHKLNGQWWTRNFLRILPKHNKKASYLSRNLSSQLKIIQKNRHCRRKDRSFK